MMPILQFARTLGKGPAPLGTVRAPHRRTQLERARGWFRVQRCWFPACAGCLALAVCVHETGAVRWAVPPACDDVPGDRLAGGAIPLFPSVRALWFAVGVQEQVPAERAAAVLPAEQAERAGVEQWPAFAAPFGPVAGLGGVIGGCPAPDQRVPDDLGPGEFGHVGAAGAVAEYPVVLPGFVVPAEVARLVIQVFGLREWRWQ